MSVIAAGVEFGCTHHYPVSVAEIDIVKRNLELHEVAMEKFQDEFDIEDNGPLVERYEDYWPIMACKGYAGMERNFRSI